MDDQDLILAQRIRDIIAVATPDIDAIMVEVEDGVAYVEGVVPCEAHRHAILQAIRELPQLTRLISCLPTEHVAPGQAENMTEPAGALPVVMHYYSLS